MALLDWMFYGNSLRTWAIAVTTALVGYFALQLVLATVRRTLLHLARRTTSQLDDLIGEIVGATRGWFLVVVALWLGSLPLLLPPRLREILGHLVVLAFLVQLGIWGGAAIRTYVGRQTQRKLQEDSASITTVRAIGFLATVLLWSIVVMMALDNLGINITALVAGLGVGGVAVALAVQNILGDLFASLSIVLDKPFVYGDFIVVDDLAGTVEKVGLKTTRIRSIAGEQLVFSNSDLLQSRIRNYKRMQERRVVATIGVVYQTSPDDLRRIPDMIREAVEALPDLRFDRAHFRDFGDSALNVEFVYYVLSADFNLFMDRQQEINLEIFRRFDAEGIGFAYPTQTLFLTREHPAPVGERPGLRSG